EQAAEVQDARYGEERGDDPFPGHAPFVAQASQHRVAEADRERRRGCGGEQAIEVALVRLKVDPFVAHEARSFRRAASRTLSAARARCRCVFTVPSGMPSASATS